MTAERWEIDTADARGQKEREVHNTNKSVTVAREIQMFECVMFYI